MFKKHLLLGGLSFILFSGFAYSQEKNSVPQGELTLDQIIDFALKNSPAVLQTAIDEEIGEHEIKSNLAGWYPQLSASAGGAYNIKLQTQVIGDQLITFGQKYNSNVLFEANQTLFNRDQLFASKTAKYYRNQLDKLSEDSKINTVVNVSKAYYDIILSEAQLKILDENLIRLDKQYRDALHRYEAGLVDKTDYQRASIALSNTRSNRNRVAQSFDAKYAYLKQLMGYPEEAEFTVPFDVEGLKNQVEPADFETLVLENRVEYQLLLTQQALNEIQTSYEKWNYVPEISAYYRYNWQYFNGNFSDLYARTYPTSSVGLSLAIPIFQGGRRNHRVKVAKLQEDRGLIELNDLGKQIQTEYQSALADYKSSVYEWETIRDNMEMAEDVYAIIKLQYDEGVKAYVDLVVAETDLQTAQINHINALYQVLLSQLDLNKALGLIKYN